MCALLFFNFPTTVDVALIESPMFFAACLYSVYWNYRHVLALCFDMYIHVFVYCDYFNCIVYISQLCVHLSAYILQLHNCNIPPILLSWCAFPSNSVSFSNNFRNLSSSCQISQDIYTLASSLHSPLVASCCFCCCTHAIGFVQLSGPTVDCRTVSRAKRGLTSVCK